MTCPHCASNLVDGSRQCNVCFATLAAPASLQPSVSASATPQSFSQPPTFGPGQPPNRGAAPSYVVNAHVPQKRTSRGNALGALGFGGGALGLILILFRIGARSFNAATIQMEKERAQAMNPPSSSVSLPTSQGGMPSGLPAQSGNGVTPWAGPRPSFGPGRPFDQMNAQHQQIQSRLDESQRRLQQTMDANQQQMHNQMQENQRRLQESMAANQQQMLQRMEEMNARARASMPSNFGPGQMHGPGFGGPAGGFPGPMGPQTMPGFGGGVR